MSSEPPIGFERPAIEPATEAKKRKFSTAPAISALTEEIALPTLRDSSSASSLRFSWIASASACSSRERSVGGVRAPRPVERGAGGVDGPVDVGLAGERGPGERLAGGGLDEVAELARSRLGRLAADEQSVLAGGGDGHQYGK